MAVPARTVTTVAGAFAAGVGTCVALVLVCELVGWNSAPEAGYRYTSALQSAVLPVFVILGPLAAVFVARWSRHSWPFALGVIVPFAAALVIELNADPTNHNLFPFEVLFVWLPAFLLSWGAGAASLALAKRGR